MLETCVAVHRKLGVGLERALKATATPVREFISTTVC